MLSFKDLINDIEVTTEDTPNNNIKDEYIKNLKDTYTPNPDQWTRFSFIMPNSLRNASVIIIGVGGIGYKLLRQLAGIGMHNLHIFDFDTIDTHNVGPQGYAWHQVGEKKVKAAKDNIFADFGIDIFTYDQKVEKYEDILDKVSSPTILCICIDNMELRKTLSEQLLKLDTGFQVDDLPVLYIDSRMSLGTWTIYTFPLRVMDAYAYSIYETFYSPEFNKINSALKYFLSEGIFSEEEGVQEPCTAREINFTGEAISAKIVSSLLYLFGNETKLNFNKLLNEDEDEDEDEDNADTHRVFSSFFDLADKSTKHKWFHSFDTLNWTEITPTIKDLSNELKITEQNRTLTRFIKHFYDMSMDENLKPYTEATTIISTKLLPEVENLVTQALSKLIVSTSIKDKEEKVGDALSKLMEKYNCTLQVGDTVKFYMADDPDRVLSSWKSVRRIYALDSSIMIDLSNGNTYTYDAIRVKYVRPIS